MGKINERRKKKRKEKKEMRRSRKRVEEKKLYREYVNMYMYVCIDYLVFILLSQ